MKMIPSLLPEKLPSESVPVYLQLATVIGPLSIVSAPQFVSDPEGLVFSNASVLDAGKTAAAFVSGGDGGVNYTVTALCSLDSGQIAQPSVSLPVVSPRSQTGFRRATIL